MALPKGIRGIPAFAFADCVSLKFLVIPEGVEEIDEIAFQDCSAWQELVIPPSVKAIGNGAFAKCFALRSMKLSRLFEGQIERIFGSIDPTADFLY